jgi:hypothetical protein
MIARSKEYYWHWKVCFLLDLHYDIENGRIPNTNRYDKRNDFTFPIVNFPFISNNIPAGPAYAVYISQLVRTMNMQKDRQG